MYYWNHPNDKETKACTDQHTVRSNDQGTLNGSNSVLTSQEAEGSISLSSSPCQSVRPVNRDSCARPFTFELVSSITQQQQDDSQEPLAK